MGNITKIRELKNVKNGDVKEKLYSKFFAYSKGFGNVDIVCKNNNGSGKETSFGFQKCSDSEGWEVTIGRVFNIQDKLKDIKKNQYIGNAHKDILTLHSSALLALLGFYNVDKDNPIVIERVKYNNVMFEVENKVIGHPSQVDVLLISEDGKTLLFLESKFTELFEQTRDMRGLKYRDYYKLCSPYIIEDAVESAKEGCTRLKYKEEEGEKKLSVEGYDSEQYCYGITQMIPHFIGLCKGPVSRADKTYKDFFNNADKLILGEILFDFPDEPDYEEMQAKIDDYKTLYAGLAKTLNDNKEKFKVVPEIKNDKERVKNIDKISVIGAALTYQDLLDKNPNYKNNLDDRVKDFYQF